MIENFITSLYMKQIFVNSKYFFAPITLIICGKPTPILDGAGFPHIMAPIFVEGPQNERDGNSAGYYSKIY